MDPTDAFNQPLDSTHLLKQYGPGLISEAREILARDPAARVAGLITLADSPDAPQVRGLITRVSGRSQPPGLLVGVVPRGVVEALLTTRFGNQPWQEQGWRNQRVLPVVVSANDGRRFAFLAMEERPEHDVEF